MEAQDSNRMGRLIHIVTLHCKDNEHARQCLEALANYGKPDALSFNCLSYEYGLKAGDTEIVYIVERWNRWKDLDSLLSAKVIPALPMYNQLLKNPFDPATDTMRIELSDV